MIRVSVLFMFVVAGVAGPAVMAQNEQRPVPARSEEAVRTDVDRVFRGFAESALFSGAVLVAHRDRVVFTNATGEANRELGALNTVDTRFRIANLSQLFTATALMRLQEAGRLDVRDPIGKHMPGWPDAYKSITIHQLLTGASGVKDVTQMPEFVRTIAVARETQELAGVILKEPVTPPAGPARPNNSAFHLIAAIIEQVGGLSFTEYVRREVIERAGLRQTAHDDPSALMPQRASGYNRVPGGFEPGPWFHMSNAVGMANLVSTTGDLHRFVRALVGGHLISGASLIAMSTAHVSPQVPGGVGRTGGIGYGISLAPSSGAWVSGGVIAGFSANFWYDPSSEWLAVVLGNVGSGSAGSALSTALQDIIAGRPFHVPARRDQTAPLASDLAALAGVWEVGNAFAIVNGQRQAMVLTIRVDGTRIFIRSTGGNEWEWFSEGPGRFFARHLDGQIVLKDGAPDEADYVQFGRASPLKRQRR